MNLDAAYARRYTGCRTVDRRPAEIAPSVELANLYADAFKDVLRRAAPVSVGSYSVEGRAIHYLEIEVPAEIYDDPDQLLAVEDIVMATVIELRPDAAGAFALRYRPA